jgi:uncharacterized protein HemY
MIGLESAQLPQSVSILWGPWVLSTTPLTLATLLAVLWAVSYLMVRLLVALGRGSTAVAGWHSTRQLRRTERELVAQWVALCRGDYAGVLVQCKKIRLRALHTRAAFSQTLSASALGALAAQRSGDSVALRGFVDSAYDAFSARVDMSQVALVAAVPESVHDALPEHLSSTGGRKRLHAYLEHTPDNVEVRLQLAWTLRKEGDWAGVHRLVASSPANLTSPAWQTLRLRASRWYLEAARSPETLQAGWKSLTPQVQQSRAMSACFARRVLWFYDKAVDVQPYGLKSDGAQERTALTGGGTARRTDALFLAVEDAHELLLGAIGELSESGSVFDEQTAREFREFIELYGMLPMQSGGAQLDNLERWLEAEPENSTLLRAAGRTCVRQRLWGKARAYLRASVSFEPTPATYFELGHLEADLGDAGASHAWFAQGANVHSKQDVPWLRAGTRC